jgi:hypothetical protein
MLDVGSIVHDIALVERYYGVEGSDLGDKRMAAV